MTKQTSNNRGSYYYENEDLTQLLLTYRLQLDISNIKQTPPLKSTNHHSEANKVIKANRTFRNESLSTWLVELCKFLQNVTNLVVEGQLSGSTVKAQTVY